MTFCNALPQSRNTDASVRQPWLSSAAGGLVALALAFGTGLAQAEKADRDKPMNIEADAMRYDDLKQTSVFTGNVVVTKGTIVLRGARIDVQQDPEGYQHGVVTAAPGKRAYFKQKRDGAPGSDEWVEGESELIEYDGRAETVKFIRQAVMRRLVGTKVNDETRGAMITYDQVNDTYSVSGVAEQQGSQPASNGRVRAVIAPRSEEKPAAPAQSAPPAGSGLRPSTTLGGPKQ
ncbi:lipopolysaccharide transport periplasmic protein LptA [Variovorax dokdonensis]|uniref:Lipopolysaccharide export system protein LptA n=1 Tax=Variovorax dokdonensis TaxID=344883 RepID=A0ABT7NAC9_9BURK|nr:lipopolysaccharide transport periplasmic protein LptA [Variovorax dokdonensis]MDM0044884.1 lipopolysaccharide transport periplasmic protein LptA [Variovorax dokdonensis]